MRDFLTKISKFGASIGAEMICVHCGKKIKEYSEKYELWGVDGDFIHTKCKKAHEREIDRVVKMKDEKFVSWLVGDINGE